MLDHSDPKISALGNFIMTLIKLGIKSADARVFLRIPGNLHTYDAISAHVNKTAKEYVQRVEYKQRNLEAKYW